MTSIIIVSVNQFQIIIVLILSILNGNWFSDYMFEFILCINWKSVLSSPWKLLYWRPWLVKFRWNRVAWEPLKRKVVTYSKEVLWIDFELEQDLLGPKGQKIYDNLDWFEGDDVLRLRTAMSGTNR